MIDNNSFDKKEHQGHEKKGEAIDRKMINATSPYYIQHPQTPKLTIFLNCFHFCLIITHLPSFFQMIGMIMQCKEIISLGSTMRIPLAKALGEAKNSTLLYARGMECISIDSGDCQPFIYHHEYTLW